MNPLKPAWIYVTFLLMFTSDSNHQSPPALKRSLYLEFVANLFTSITISLLETVVIKNIYVCATARLGPKYAQDSKF